MITRVSSNCSWGAQQTTRDVLLGLFLCLSDWQTPPLHLLQLLNCEDMHTGKDTALKAFWCHIVLQLATQVSSRFQHMHALLFSVCLNECLQKVKCGF
jgi:hypothetical protein